MRWLREVEAAASDLDKDFVKIVAVASTFSTFISVSQNPISAVPQQGHHHDDANQRKGVAGNNGQIGLKLDKPESKHG